LPMANSRVRQQLLVSPAAADSTSDDEDSYDSDDSGEEMKLEEAKLSISTFQEACEEGEKVRNYHRLIQLQGELSLERIMNILEFGGTECGSFLELLSIRILIEDCPALFSRRFQGHHSRMTMGRGPYSLKNVTKEAMEEKSDFLEDVTRFLTRLAPQNHHNHSMLHRAQTHFLHHWSEVEFHWSGCIEFVELLGPWEGKEEGLEETKKRLTGRAQMLRVMLAADPDSQVFTTPIGRILLSHIMLSLRSPWITVELMSFIQLVAISVMTYYLNSNVDENGGDFHQKPGAEVVTCCIWLITIIGMLQCLAQVIEVIMFCRVYGSVTTYFTQWNVGCLLSNIITIAVMLTITVQVTLHANGSLLGYNFIMPLVTGARCFLFIVNLLILRPLGKTVLPAFYAASSRDAVEFLWFVMIFLVALTQIYVAFPVKDDDHTLNKYGLLGGLEAFMRMLKLAVFADLDFDDLAGKIKHVDPATGEIQTTGGLTTHASFYNELRLFSIISATFGSMIIMNVYISVLGNSYNNFKQKSEDVLRSELAKFAQKLTLRDLYWKSLAGNFDSWIRPGFRAVAGPGLEGSFDRLSPLVNGRVQKFDTWDGLWFVGRSYEKSVVDVNTDRLEGFAAKLEKMASRVERTN